MAEQQEANRANRTNQCNPLDAQSGPGHTASYTGSGTKADLNNHSNQMNGNNLATINAAGYARCELVFPTHKVVTLHPPNGGQIIYREEL